MLSHERMLLSPLATTSGHWDQIEMVDWALPIPISGYVVTNDPVFGNVVIYPDVTGMLHYTQVTSQVATQVQKQHYESPGQSFEDILQGMSATAASLGKTLLTFGGIALAIWGFSVVKGSK